MSNTTPNDQIESLSGSDNQRKSPPGLLSVLQFSLALLALIALWGGAVIALLAGFLTAGEYNGELSTSLPLFLIASSVFTAGLLVLPSMILSLRRIINRPVAGVSAFPQQRWPAFIILLLPPVLVIGHFAATHPTISWIALPPLHILAVLLPSLWLVFLAVRGLSIGSRQRAWGVFDSGLVLGPIIIMFFELIAVILLIVIGVFYISSDSELSRAILSLSEEIYQGSPNPEMLTELLAPYLSSPVLIIAVFAFVAGLVPLVEEALKPVGVLLLIGRPLSQAEGFAAGALSGAGFAIFESLAATSSGESWVILVVARVGTAIIHILTTSLMGWALVSAWRQKRYLRLLGTYLGVVILHGAWNALTVNSLFSGIFNELQITTSTIFPQLGAITPLILGIFAALAFAALIWVNRLLRLDRNAKTDDPRDPASAVGEQPDVML